MADQNPNPSTQANIDDLVKELSRPQGAPAVTPAAPTPSPVKPAMPAMPAPSAPMPPRPVAPAPVAPVAPKPAQPAPAPVAAAPAPQAYQSNIRTMADDMASLKSGQQPQGTTAPRTPAAPVAPAPVAPVAPKPAQPVPAPAPVMSNASMPKPTPSAAMPKPSMPQAPSAPVAAPKSSNQFYVPETPVSGGSKNSRSLLFAGAGVAVVVLAVLYWFFFIKPGTPAVEVPIQTATPTAVPTATPLVPVSMLFQGSAGTIAFGATGDPLTTLTTGEKVLSLAPGQLGVLTVTDAGRALLPLNLFDRLGVAYPVDLKPASSSADGVILAYGQSESFNAKGQPVQNTTASVRLAFVTRVSSSAAASLRSWETSMTDNLAALFSINKAKNTGPFSDALYQSTTIRFKNFAFPDMTIDYTLVSYNGQSYLVMANSREAMYATLNVLHPLGK